MVHRLHVAWPHDPDPPADERAEFGRPFVFVFCLFVVVVFFGGVPACMPFLTNQKSAFTKRRDFHLPFPSAFMLRRKGEESLAPYRKRFVGTV